MTNLEAALSAKLNRMEAAVVAASALEQERARELAEANAKLASASEAFSQLRPTLLDHFEGTRAWPLVQALANALLGRGEGCGEGEGGGDE